MHAPYVCLRCCRQLLRWKCQRRNSGFVSLGRLVGRDDDSRKTPQEAPLANGNPTPIGNQRRKKRLTFAQQYQEQRKPKGVDKVLETLFASNRDNEQALERNRYSRTPKVQHMKDAAIERSAIEWSSADRLRELHNKLLRGTAPLQEIWRDCESLLAKKWIRKDAMANGVDQKLFDYSSTSIDTQANYEPFRDILVAICQKQRLVINGRDFAPADAIKKYMKYGVMRHWWHDVLWCQLGNVLRLRYQSTDDTRGVAPDERIRILLEEILEVWNVYIERYKLYPSSVLVPLSGNSDKMDDKASTSEGFSSSDSKKLRTKPPDETTEAAAMTARCLKAAGMRASLQIMSLFHRFGHAMKRDRSIATTCLLHAGVSSEITEKALEGWESQSSPEPKDILDLTEKPNQSRGSKISMSASQKRHGLDWSDKGLRKRLAEIEGTSKRLDTISAMDLWSQFQVHREADNSKNSTISIDKLYACFLRLFWALHLHDHAIEVWNHMIKSGCLPNHSHYNAMLIGCMKVKDIDSLQEIWTNMLRSGMTPDADNWTTYIHGLICRHKWEEGFKALESLGQTWKSAPPLESSNTAIDETAGTKTAEENQSPLEPKNKTPLRPSLAPINAALSALIKIDKPFLIPRVLDWARSHQITLSTMTFNILLRPLVRRGSQASIQAHLQQMADAKCTPDVATFTIILNGLVSNPTSTFHTLPPEAQESTVLSILADMARQGIEPNAFTYSSLLYGLLTPASKELARDFTPNVPAARTILAHMVARNLRPAQAIYTILITHYFTRRPLPDLPAISSLWSALRHSGQANTVDYIFLDRMIEGYADADEIEEALKFLKMMPELGRFPGWRALVKVMKAMIRAKEWVWCGELVEDVVREDGLRRWGHGRSRPGYKEFFWELVKGLRERDLVPKMDEER